jgi:hypothetical protein
MFILSLNNIYLWSLPKLYYCHSGLVEKHGKENLEKRPTKKT